MAAEAILRWVRQKINFHFFQCLHGKKRVIITPNMIKTLRTPTYMKIDVVMGLLVNIMDASMTLPKSYNVYDKFEVLITKQVPIIPHFFNCNPN